MATLENLIELFSSQSLIECGTTSIWGDYFGKPGDRIVTLKGINFLSKNNSLLLEFNLETIRINNPEEVIIGAKGFKILNAKSIERITNQRTFSYTNCSNDKPAFAFEGW